MKEIIIKKEDRILQVVNKILTSEDIEVKIEIPGDSILFQNILNLKIFQRALDSSGKIAKIETSSEAGRKMLSQVRNNNQDDADFSRYQESFEKPSQENEIDNNSKKTNFKLPNFTLPKINLPNLKMLPIVFAGVGIVFGLIYYFLIYNLTVDLEILVSSERFVKSYEVTVSSIRNTDVEDKVLRAESFNTIFKAEKEVPTTGKVEGGKKAEGEVKFLNKTDKVIELKKDTKLLFKESGKELVYLLTDSVEIPSRTLTSTAPETFVSGEKIETAVASVFGSTYNLSAGKSLSVSGYQTSELSAVVSSSFEGGVKNTLNAVSEEDIKMASKLSFEDFKNSFSFSTIPGKEILKNSETFSIARESFSSKLTEASDKLTVSQEILVSYLSYDSNQVLSFVKASMDSLIPDGYELYGKDLQIELNSLGSVSGTNYDNKETKAQLTVKSYKIPTINPDDIKEKVKGKNVSEVSEILDGMDLNYNIESSSGLLNLLGFPNEVSKINVAVTKQ